MCPPCNCCPVVQHQLSLGVVVAPERCHIPESGCKEPVNVVRVFYLLPVLADTSVVNN